MLPSNTFVYGRWGYKLKRGPRNEPSVMGSVIVEHEMEAIMRGPRGGGGGGQRQYLDEFVAGTFQSLPPLFRSTTNG